MWQKVGQKHASKKGYYSFANPAAPISLFFHLQEIICMILEALYRKSEIIGSKEKSTWNASVRIVVQR
ncbi:MAG: hypothetical protein QW087_08150 [Methanomassiliicoccales archaeon]